MMAASPRMTTTGMALTAENSAAADGSCNKTSNHRIVSVNGLAQPRPRTIQIDSSGSSLPEEKKEGSMTAEDEDDVGNPIQEKDVRYNCFQTPATSSDTESPPRISAHEKSFLKNDNATTLETPTVTPEGKASSSPPVMDEMDTKSSPTPSTNKALFLSLESQQSEVSELGDFSPETEFRPQRHHRASRGRTASSRGHDDDDDDSSNDDSSYFADPSNLPSPKSGHRRFSPHLGFNSGGGSVTHSLGVARSEAISRESDASLSLSDDSDDGMDNHGSGHILYHHHSSPMVLAAPAHAPMVPELYPRPITRMHSVSSLVSTSSQCSTNTEVQDDELKDVIGDRAPVAATDGSVPSGRLSPILGQHPPSRGNLNAGNGVLSSNSNISHHNSFQSPAQPSPPTILGTYPGIQGMEFGRDGGLVVAHPQPHQMTSNEHSHWIANASHDQYAPPTMFPVIPSLMFHDDPSPLSREGSKESYLCYSEDSEGMSANLTSKPIANATIGGDTGGYMQQSHFPGGSAQRSNQENNGAGHGGYGGSSDGQWSSNNNFGGNASNYNSIQKDFQSKSSFNSRSKSSKDEITNSPQDERRQGFKVYWQRWIMLMYMSALNLLSDWTCYSVAPIAVMTEEAFGNIDPEKLVVVFLGANAVATACEPMILSRLGLRRTVLFGALLLMIGSIVKSGGMPPIIQADLKKGEGEWRVYLGFFLVGLSQPLYQCTPALLSASWFPERERTMATGVALNANQLGIGFAFIFGTLLVENSDDIPGYFSLLSVIATIAFFGVLCHFDDAPPTPPSETAKVMKGTLDVQFPSVRSIFQTVRALGTTTSTVAGTTAYRDSEVSIDPNDVATTSDALAASLESSEQDGKNLREKPASDKKYGMEATSKRRHQSSHKGQDGAAASIPTTARSQSGGPRKRSSSHPHVGNDRTNEGFHGFVAAPSPVIWKNTTGDDDKGYPTIAPAPSPANWDEPTRNDESNDIFRANLSQANASPVATVTTHLTGTRNETSQENNDTSQERQDYSLAPVPPNLSAGNAPSYPQYPYSFPLNPMQYPQGQFIQGAGFESGNLQTDYQGHQGAFLAAEQYGVPGYTSGYMAQPYWDPRYQQYMYMPQPPQHPQYQAAPLPPRFQYGGYPHPHPHLHPHLFSHPLHRNYDLPEGSDIGAEPVITVSPHHLDINIRDDQILLSIRACLKRPGFIHALVSFTVSGIVINTLSTFMDYLVRLNGAGREYTGIVGGSFQFVIMISSLIIGQLTDNTRAYYSVTIGMLVLGAFGLAQCGVDLDSEKGIELRWSLIIVAALVGPLQPVSTELGVDVVYPLSENTVLVIQQLFANLLSALFIPCFKAFKDIGVQQEDSQMQQHPQYTFSFYLLIVLHAAATVFFATFNGRYLRYEHELLKKEEGDERDERDARENFAREDHPLLAATP